MDELLTDHEAAQLLKCSRAALVRFRQERRGPPFVKVGKLVRYSQSDLKTWLDSERVTTDLQETR
jgi:excisionase family DNA binding protein